MNDPEPEWKLELRERFETWLQRLNEAPRGNPGSFNDTSTESPETPDLHSFYTELASLASEVRRSNRRIAEAISTWTDSLRGIAASIEGHPEAAVAGHESPAGPSSPSPALLTDLIRLRDRFDRVTKAFETSAPAPKRWFRRRKTGPDPRVEGLRIVADHFDALLAGLNLQRLETIGTAFDPSRMRAVATRQVAGQTRQVVLEEVSPGYRLHDQLIRPAEVVVSQSNPQP